MRAYPLYMLQEQFIIFESHIFSIFQYTTLYTLFLFKMNFTRVCIVLLLIVLASCEHVKVVKQAVIKKLEAGKQQSAEENTQKRTKKNGLVKTRRKNGTLLSEINFKDGKMHGISKSYYPDGTTHFIYPYNNGVLEGDLLWYYRNGKLYKTTPYINGKIEGTAKTFNQAGELIGETPYKNNFAGLGLKEYTSKGNLKKCLSLSLKLLTIQPQKVNM